MQLGRQSMASSSHLSGEREAALIAQGIQHAIREAISGLIKAPWRRARGDSHRSGYLIRRGPHERGSRPECSLIASLMKAPARTPPSALRADAGASRPPACNEGGNHQPSRGTTSLSEAMQPRSRRYNLALGGTTSLSEVQPRSRRRCLMIASRGAISGCQRWVPDCLPHQLKRRNPWLLKMGSNLGLIWV